MIGKFDLLKHKALLFVIVSIEKSTIGNMIIV